MDLVENELKLVTRKEWVAMRPKVTYPMTHPILRVVYTVENNMEPCFTKEDCIKAVKYVQCFYCDPGLEDIPYNFLVGTDGHVYEGRGWNHRPAISSTKDPTIWDQTLEIGILGGHKFSSKKVYRSIRQAFQAAQDLVQYGINKNYITKDFKASGFSEELIPPDDHELCEDSDVPDEDALPL